MTLILQDFELWQKFNSVTNEMIVTKSGRSGLLKQVSPIPADANTVRSVFLSPAQTALGSA